MGFSDCANWRCSFWYEIWNFLVFLTWVSFALEFGRFITADTIPFRYQYFAKGQRGAKSLLANVQHGGLEWWCTQPLKDGNIDAKLQKSISPIIANFADFCIFLFGILQKKIVIFIVFHLPETEPLKFQLVILPMI